MKFSQLIKPLSQEKIDKEQIEIAKIAKNNLTIKLRNLYQRGRFNNEIITHIEIIDSLCIKNKLKKNQYLSHFDKSGYFIPLTLNITTKADQYTLQLFDDESVKFLQKYKNGVNNESSDFWDFIIKNELNSQQKSSWKDICEKCMYKFIKGKINSSNHFLTKNKCEEQIQYYLDNKNDETYKLAKLSLAYYLKTYFFTQLKKNKRFSEILNSDFSYENYAQDYILYNHLRGKNIDCGLSNINKEKLQFGCPYDHFYYSRYVEDGKCMIQILNEIKNIAPFIKEIIDDINFINNNEKLLPRENIFKNLDKQFK